MTSHVNLARLRQLATTARDAALRLDTDDSMDAHNASEQADIALAESFPTGATFVALLDEIDVHARLRDLTGDRITRMWDLMTDEQRARIDI